MIQANAVDIAGLLDEVAALDAHELGNLIDAIIQSPTLSVWALGRWLTTNTDIDIAAARRLVRKLSDHYLAADIPVRFDLSALRPTDAMLAGFRLCALGVTLPVSLGWVLALLRLPDEAAQLDDALKLLQYHWQEYPYTTQRLLDSADAGLKPDLTVRIGRISSLLKQQADALEQAKLKEFNLSHEEWIALQGLKLRKQREIHRHAEQRSKLWKLIKQSCFKYSRDAVVETTAQGQTSDQILSMRPHGVPFESPLSERLDPLTSQSRHEQLWDGTAS
ncbi:hypothetical protein D8B25_02520 [Verminephrobacter aporrectodeae subsp. tuberculatae]|nr:hypothetical protein [Verminephrobacter aporrectodeae subsp. tuberculatae]MCW8201978.1 hypothetical protein [Verminephrobacter aporrectodeae subsp. tuberculatae]